MKQKNFIYYQDAGHGWIACRRALLQQLGIEQDITPFSYQRGGTVYLEEDCDASALVIALMNRNIKANFRRQYRELSPIRKYEPFRVSPNANTSSDAGQLLY